LTSKAILHRKVLRWVDQVKEQGRVTWVGTLGENGERRGVGIPLKDDNLVHGTQHQATEVNDNGSKCVVDAQYSQQQQHSLLSQVIWGRHSKSQKNNKRKNLIFLNST